MKSEFYLSNSHCPIHNVRSRWANTHKCMACVDYDGTPHTDMKVEFEKLIIQRKQERLERDRLRHVPKVVRAGDHESYRYEQIP